MHSLLHGTCLDDLGFSSRRIKTHLAVRGWLGKNPCTTTPLPWTQQNGKEWDAIARGATQPSLPTSHTFNSNHMINNAEHYSTPILSRHRSTTPDHECMHILALNATIVRGHFPSKTRWVSKSLTRCLKTSHLISSVKRCPYFDMHLVAPAFKRFLAWADKCP